MYIESNLLFYCFNLFTFLNSLNVFHLSNNASKITQFSNAQIDISQSQCEQNS